MKKDVNPRPDINELVTANTGLFVKLAKAFKPSSAEQLDEYIQIARIAFWQAAINHDDSIRKLSGRAYEYGYWAIIRHLKFHTKHNKVVSSVKYKLSLEELIQDKDSLWEIIPENLTDMEYDIIQLRIKKHTFKEIGEMMGGLSYQWIHKVYIRALSKIVEAHAE